MAYYKTCDKCGAHLDPGEICDCSQEEKPTVVLPLERKSCCICGNPIYRVNSAEPIMEGECCETCFHKQVLPTRLEMNFARLKKESAGIGASLI